MKFSLITAALLSTIFFVSCSSDDDQPQVENNVEAPATYNFMRNNESSVDFSG